MESPQAEEQGLSLSWTLVPGLAALWSFQSGADGEWAVCARRSRWVCFCFGSLAQRSLLSFHAVSLAQYPH